MKGGLLHEQLVFKRGFVRMGWVSLLTLAVALAMDAFAVAVVTGLTLDLVTRRHLFRLSFHFGLFQAMMTGLGWAAGAVVQRYIASFDHWVAFALLALVGGNMIRGSLGNHQEHSAPDLTSGRNLVMVSVATSIDALAVGLSLGMIGTAIAIPALVIGVTAALLTLSGMALGRRIGAGWGTRVEVFGGLVLIAIGVKVVLQHVM